MPNICFYISWLDPWSLNRPLPQAERMFCCQAQQVFLGENQFGKVSRFTRTRSRWWEIDPKHRQHINPHQSTWTAHKIYIHMNPHEPTEIYMRNRETKTIAEAYDQHMVQPGQPLRIRGGVDRHGQGHRWMDLWIGSWTADVATEGSWPNQHGKNGTRST